jgi:hypothetical protein
VAPTTKVDAPSGVLRVGDPKGSRNQAIVALAVRTAPSAVTRSVFVSVANLDLEPATRRVENRGDDHLVETRTIRIDAQQKADVIVDDVPADVGTIEVRLTPDDSDPAARPDLLAADDRAWAIVPPRRPGTSWWFGPGDRTSRPPSRTCRTAGSSGWRPMSTRRAPVRPAARPGT